MDDGRGAEPRVLLILAIIFAVIAVGAVIDLLLDDPQSWLGPHVLFELTLAGVSLGATVYLGRGWYRTVASVGRLESQLEEHREERDRWKASAEKLLQGLASAIDGQFDRWALTPAERETAMMLLKGYSHKRIARLTDRSERTVRQHAVSVYRKSGLSGRSELAAYFLEDLPVPGAEGR